MGRALLAIYDQNVDFTGALPITHPAGSLDCYERHCDSVTGFRADRETGGLELLEHHFSFGHPSCAVLHDLNKVG